MAVSKNDITGDSLISKNSGNSAYADGWERIFKKTPETVCLGACSTCKCSNSIPDAPIEEQKAQ